MLAQQLQQALVQAKRQVGRKDEEQIRLLHRDSIKRLAQLNNLIIHVLNDFSEVHCVSSHILASIKDGRTLGCAVAPRLTCRSSCRYTGCVLARSQRRAGSGSVYFWAWKGERRVPGTRLWQCHFQYGASGVTEKEADGTQGQIRNSHTEFRASRNSWCERNC